MKWMKGYLAGLLTALLLCGLVVTAGAKSGKVMQELTYRDIRVSLDGEVLDLRNAIGEPVEPFMFDGTNYLPVRALAEALGLNVAWDGAEVMVVLTTPVPVSVTSGGAITQTPQSEAAQTENPVPVAEPEAKAIKAPENPEPITETMPEPEPVKTQEPSNKADFGEYQVEINGARLARNYDDSLAIVIAIKWTNNSKHATSALTAMKMRAFQNGAELSTAFPEDFDSDLYWKRIEPGETQEVERAFTLADDMTPVEITISDILERTENPAKMTFNSSEMKQPASIKKAETPKSETQTTVSTPTVTNDRTVYVTKTGKHYHYSGSCNGGNYYRSTLSEALARGLTPCDKCVLTGN